MYLGKWVPTFRGDLLPSSCTPKTETADSFSMLVCIWQITLHISELSVNIRHCKCVRSLTTYIHRLCFDIHKIIQCISEMWHQNIYLKFPRIKHYSVIYHLHTRKDTLLNNISTNSMEQSPFREANRSSVIQKTPRILWKPKVYYSNHKRPPPVPTLQQSNLNPRLPIPRLNNPF